jgi:hypothetical protein
MLNRTRLSSLDAFGLRDQRNRIYPALEASDGSTLSLDFTQMSSLDSRFTFSRSSPATFINSSGLVRYADHNLWFNTAYSGLSGANPSLTSSGWQYTFAGAGKTATFNGNGSVTISTSSGTDRLGLARATSIPNTTLNLVVSVDIVADNSATYGTLTASDLVSEGSVTDVAFYIDGVSVAGSTVITGPCNLTWVIQKTGGGTVTPNFGVNLRQARSGAFTIRFANPRFGYWIGAAPFPYLANTSTSVERHDARFDYDPTTLTARGLLIEGSATNLLKYSAYADTNWIAYGGYTKSYTTGITSPANDTTAARITFSAVGNGLFTNNTQMAYTNTVGATYTFSAWIRATSNTTNPNIRFGDSAVASSPNIPISTSWVRYSYSYVAVSASGPQIQSASGTATGEFEMWGFQLETGSGASSYIPTGASTVQRAIDICTMSNIAAINYNANGGTLFAHFSNNTENGNFAGSIAFNNGGNYAQRFRWGSGVLLASYFQTNGTSALGSNLNGSRTSLGSAKAATSYSFDGTTTSNDNAYEFCYIWGLYCYVFKVKQRQQ